MRYVRLEKGDKENLESAIEHMRYLIESGDIEVQWARQIAFRKQDDLIGIAMEQIFTIMRETGKTYSEVLAEILSSKQRKNGEKE